MQKKFSVSPLAYVQRFAYIDDMLWITARNGIGMLDENGFHEPKNIPLDNSVGNIMCDYEGNIWFTSTRQGVMKVVPNQFLNVFEQYGLEKTVVNSTCMLDGRLYVATDTGLIVLGDEKEIKEVP